MDQNKEKSLNQETLKSSNQLSKAENLKTTEMLPGQPHGETIRQVVENAEFNETVEEKAFSEKGKSVYHGGGTSGKPAQAPATIMAAPSVDVMIKQTVEAVQNELKKNEQEMRAMLKNKKTSYYQINNQAQRIRFLNGILLQLSRAARLAEEFIVGLWKQYVKKV